MYDHGRYFAVTGQHWPGTPEMIEDRQAEVDALYHQLFPEKQKKRPERETAHSPQPEARSLADDELVEKATKAKNGDKFARLFAGDTSDYDGDESRADAAFCVMLAFWTDRDFIQMDRIFRSSGLMRPKWEEKRGESTYGELTIHKACSLVQETYRGPCRFFGGKNSPSKNGDAHSTNGDGSNHHRKPTIILGTDEERVNNEAIAALSDHQAAPEVFQRGNMLVRVLRSRKTGKQARIDRPEGTPRIGIMPPARVRELLTRVADIFKAVEKKGGSGSIELVPAHPPDYTISAVVARGDYPAIRGLEAVVEAPTLRPDGTILNTPGWDEETGLLYIPNADFPPIPQAPSRGEAMVAVDSLLDLIHDFPFAGIDANEQFNHRAAWLSAALTALARFAIHGPCPLFLFDANSPGTGKSKLVDIIAIIATGRDKSRTPFPDDDTELRKQITAMALAGDRLMLFDNIAQGSPFGGAALDAALTGTTWQERILGKSELTPELPLLTVFFATGNNVQLRGDVQRRVIPCRLETKEEKPEERADFKYPNLLEHVRANRPQLVCDALTILRAFAVAGSPQTSLPAFGSYEAWCRLVRQAVFWLTKADPWATRDKIRAADPALNTLAALLEGWSELPGGKTGISVADALRILNDPNRQDDFTVLRGAFMEWSRNDRLPGSGTVGHKLRSFRKQVMGKRMLDADPGHGGVQKWRVVQIG